MKRVLSLLPSTTEIIFALGGEAHLVGITHECDFPAATSRIPRVTSARIHPDMPSDEIDQLVRSQLDESGSLYQLDMELVRQLQPDIVLTQQLCTVCAVGYETVRHAMKSLPSPPEVINIEPKNLAEVFQSIQSIGKLIGAEEQGVKLVAELRDRLEAVPRIAPQRILFLEWLIPPFSAGHWMPELVEAAGGTPLYANPGSHSRQLEEAVLASSEIDTYLLSFCGFGVERGMQDLTASGSISGTIRDRIREGATAILFDGNHFFSRPGPRLVESVELISESLRGIPPEQAVSSIERPYRRLEPNDFPD